MVGLPRRGSNGIGWSFRTTQGQGSAAQAGKAGSERRRSGLSPAVTSRAPATSGPTPVRSLSAGANPPDGYAGRTHRARITRTRARARKGSWVRWGHGFTVLGLATDSGSKGHALLPMWAGLLASAIGESDQIRSRLRVPLPPCEVRRPHPPFAMPASERTPRGGVRPCGSGPPDRRSAATGLGRTAPRRPIGEVPPGCGPHRSRGSGAA
jgi:hypothetical protein